MVELMKLKSLLSTPKLISHANTDDSWQSILLKIVTTYAFLQKLLFQYLIFINSTKIVIVDNYMLFQFFLNIYCAFLIFYFHQNRPLGINSHTMDFYETV